MIAPGTVQVTAKVPPVLTDTITVRPLTPPNTSPRVQTPGRPKTPVNPPVAPAPQRQPIFVEAGITEPTREQVRERAYQIYLSRNGSQGSAENDWFLAEAQLRAEARRKMNLS